MTGSREASPDWLREFQAPTQSFVTLSSDSESSLDVKSEWSDHTQQEEPYAHQKRTGKSRTVKPRTETDRQDSVLIDSGEDRETNDKKIKALKTEKKHNLGEDPPAALEDEPAEEDVNEKPIGPPVSSRLPLLFPDKVQRSKALVECNGDTIDLSGDVGAVGRVVVSNGPAGNHEMLLDLKGTIYKSTIVPSRTFCIVTVGQSEAKIEAIMNDFIQLEPQSNVFEAETMIEGTLDGFSFDSDEDGDKIPKSSAHQQDQNNENGDQANTKTKRKVDKSSDAVKKKAKIAGKTQKKGPRKPQTVKKTKKAKR